LRLLKNRSVWNIAVFYVVGLVFTLPLVLGSIRDGDPVQLLVQVLSAQFTWLIMGAMLNPFAGLAMTWALVTVVMLDTAKGQIALAKAKPLTRKLFGSVLPAVIALAGAAVLAVLIQALNNNIWASISWLPLAQVAIFLGLRQWKHSSAKSTNA
jgi:hypothetical protein